MRFHHPIGQDTSPAPVAVYPKEVQSVNSFQSDLSRCLRNFFSLAFQNRTALIEKTGLNPGHLSNIMKGAADSKMSTFFRFTREAGHCPAAVICDLCHRRYGTCEAVPFCPAKIASGN